MCLKLKPSGPNDAFACQTECFLSVSEMSKRGSRWPPIRLCQCRQSALWCHIKHADSGSALSSSRQHTTANAHSRLPISSGSCLAGLIDPKFSNKLLTLPLPHPLYFLLCLGSLINPVRFKQTLTCFDIVLRGQHVLRWSLGI